MLLNTGENILNMEVITKRAIKIRKSWVEKIRMMKGEFATNSTLIEEQLGKDFRGRGNSGVVNHLRLCGNIPESYGHDTSEEKQYSKYTDAVLAYAYKAIGLRSLIITERADVADVEGFGKKFSFVADAKAFRLSRTAKNQKDFKVQAMDKWKHGKKYAMVVCPIYQLPKRTSQIYRQAITRNVCIFTYSHLSLLVKFADVSSAGNAEELLYQIFNVIPALNISKSAVDYWLGVNKTMINFSPKISDLWREEKLAAVESIEVGKQEALEFLASVRERIMNMSHEEALKELVKASKIERKIKTIQKVSDNGLLDVIK